MRLSRRIPENGNGPDPSPCLVKTRRHDRGALGQGLSQLVVPGPPLGQEQVENHRACPSRPDRSHEPGEVRPRPGPRSDLGERVLVNDDGGDLAGGELREQPKLGVAKGVFERAGPSGRGEPEGKKPRARDETGPKSIHFDSASGIESDDYCPRTRRQGIMPPPMPRPPFIMFPITT